MFQEYYYDMVYTWTLKCYCRMTDFLSNTFLRNKINNVTTM